MVEAYVAEKGWDCFYFANNFNVSAKLRLPRSNLCWLADVPPSSSSYSLHRRYRCCCCCRKEWFCCHRNPWLLPIWGKPSAQKCHEAVHIFRTTKQPNATPFTIISGQPQQNRMSYIKSRLDILFWDSYFQTRKFHCRGHYRLQSFKPCSFIMSWRSGQTLRSSASHPCLCGIKGFLSHYHRQR